MSRKKTAKIPNPDEASIGIVSGRTSPPTCKVTWNALEFVLKCDEVRDFAGEMTAAAAQAEVQAAVTKVLRTAKAGDKVVAQFIGELRAAYPQHGFGQAGRLTFLPAVSVFDGRPFVHANIAPYEPLRIDPDTLRGIAMQWVETAEAAERDTLFDYALREATTLTDDDIEQVFAVARGIRSRAPRSNRSSS